MKFSRLFQPRNPMFWIFIAINVLSSLISLILRTYELPFALMLILAGFAIANVFVGLRMAVQLMKS